MVSASERAAFAFGDALLALRDVGRDDVADELRARWSDVEPEILALGGESPPAPDEPWIGRLYDARFSAEETTAWERLVAEGRTPDEATAAMIASRRT